MTKKHVKSAVAEQQELQEKFIQLQVMKQQAQSYLEEKQKVDSALTELTMTLEAMKKLKGAKKDLQKRQKSWKSALLTCERLTASLWASLQGLLKQSRRLSLKLKSSQKS